MRPNPPEPSPTVWDESETDEDRLTGELTMTKHAYALLAGLFTLAASGCIIVEESDDDAGSGTATASDDGGGPVGDSDGTSSDGGGASGGSSDAGVTSGDGDTGSAGDGDGDGDSDSDSGGTTGGTPLGCGWGTIMDANLSMAYICGGEGADPTDTFPLECPDNLVAGGECGSVTGAGCCDANGDVWFCTEDFGTPQLFQESCTG